MGNKFKSVLDCTIVYPQGTPTFMDFMQGKVPEIIVDIFQYHGIYVTGEVTNPGRYEYSQGLTVAQAIATAGGFNSRADKKKILLVKPGTSEQVETELSRVLKPGDTLIINRGSVFF